MMNYDKAPKAPTVQSPLYDALGADMARDKRKIQQIKQSRGAKYDAPKAPGKKVFTSGSLDELFT